MGAIRFRMLCYNKKQPQLSETDAMEEPVIALRDIWKSYRNGLTRTRKVAVEDLSLEIEKGGIFGLLGPNGAGKTTTLKVILGLVLPDSGSGSVLGRPLGNPSAHHRLGFLPEQPYFYSFMNAEKGLALYGKLFGLDSATIRSRTSDLLELVGLQHDPHLTLDKYSKGMLQRFGIAQALLNDPELVIMDEPSSGLDPVGQKEVRDVLLHIKEEGRTIFLSSHQLSEVENICDSVSIVNHGRVVREGRLADLLSTEGLMTITVRGDDRSLLDKLLPVARKVEQRDGNTVLEVESERMHEALEMVQELDLELISAAPQRRSLEDLFLETVRESPD
jgi:ABC-2 type transport system ATP-binding protein